MGSFMFLECLFTVEELVAALNTAVEKHCYDDVKFLKGSGSLIL